MGNDGQVGHLHLLFDLINPYLGVFDRVPTNRDVHGTPWRHHEQPLSADRFRVLRKFDDFFRSCAVNPREDR
jgi:hypothetical protein